MYKKFTKQLLKELGVPNHILGYGYVADAIVTVVHDRSKIYNITKVLYPEVAARHNTTPSRVERAIRHAIECAFDNDSMEAIHTLFGGTISLSKGRPTNKHFISACAERVSDLVAEQEVNV